MSAEQTASGTDPGGEARGETAEGQEVRRDKAEGGEVRGAAVSATSARRRIVFVTGGARSGKSAYAEGLLAAHPAPVYVATAEPFDTEMQARVAQHRQRRGRRWTTVEAPLDVGGALASHRAPGAGVLVDCLSVWLGNLHHHEHDVDRAVGALLQSLAQAQGTVILVASEVGLGLVPATPLGRAFRDRAGALNQAVAAHADRAIFVCAGLPLALKGELPTGGST